MVAQQDRRIGWKSKKRRPPSTYWPPSMPPAKSFALPISRSVYLFLATFSRTWLLILIRFWFGSICSGNWRCLYGWGFGEDAAALYICCQGLRPTGPEFFRHSPSQHRSRGLCSPSNALHNLNVSLVSLIRVWIGKWKTTTVIERQLSHFYKFKILSMTHFS